MSRAIGWASLLLVVACGGGGGGGGGGNPPPGDTTPPSVSSTVPLAGAYVQDLSAPLAFTFSEPLDPGSVTSSTITVTAGGTLVSGALTCSGAIVTFAPAGGWAPNRVYAVAVTAAVRDLAGNAATPYSFEIVTRAVEAYRPPLIVTLWPVEGSAESSPDSAIAVVFQEAIDPGTVTPSSLRVTRDGAPVGGLLTVSGPSVGFAPSQPLEHGATYVVTLGTGIRTASGAQLAREFSWTFGVRAIAGAPLVVSATTHAISEPQIAADAAGNLVVAWLQSDGTSTIYGVHYDVYAARRSAAGAWSAPETVSLVAPGSAMGLQLVCGAAGGCLAAWQQYDPGLTWVSRIWAASYAAGTGWSTPVELDSDLVGPIGEEVGLVLAATPDLRAVAMWTADANGAVLANRYVPGSGWVGPVVVDAPTTQAGQTGIPAVAMDASGSAVAVWATTMHNADLNGRDVYSSRSDAGGLWTAPEPIESAAESAYYYPAVAVDGTGAALAVWSQGGETRWNCYVPGAGWGTAGTLSGTAGSTYSLGVESSGKTLVLYDAGGGTWAAEYTGTWGAAYRPPFQVDSFVTPRIDVAPDGSEALAWAGPASSNGTAPPTGYEYVWIDRRAPGAGWTAVPVAGLGAAASISRISLVRAGTGELAAAWTDGTQVWVSALR